MILVSEKEKLSTIKINLNYNELILNLFYTLEKNYNILAFFKKFMEFEL